MGYGIARRLAEEGASMVVNDRAQDRVDEALARLRDDAPKGEVVGVAADVIDASDVERLIEDMRTSCEHQPVHPRPRAGHSAASDFFGLRGFRDRRNPALPALPSPAPGW
jgi:NAD(P)-dependent dehydrogenase (short-subunit alcohol dehydrogenase family)